MADVWRRTTCWVFFIAATLFGLVLFADGMRMYLTIYEVKLLEPEYRAAVERKDWAHALVVTKRQLDILCRGGSVIWPDSECQRK